MRPAREQLLAEVARLQRGEFTEEELRQRLKKEYEGQTEPCCECGSDYPRGDLVIDGEIYCPSHRRVGP